MKRRVAVYCASQRLYKDTIPAIKSMLLNGHPDKIYFLIEDDEFPGWLPEQVQTINVIRQPYFRLDGPNMQTNFTYMALMRAALTKVLPDEDEVLSLDCDTLVMGDISELWDVDLKDYYLTAGIEPQRCRWDNVYYNTGVVKYNLKLIREDGVDDHMIRLINECKLKWPEQDVVNIVCKNRIMKMPSDFNYNNYSERTDDVRIKHHCGFNVTSWAGFQDVNHFRRLSWETVLAKYN